jgi:hypothetical protein
MVRLEWRLRRGNEKQTLQFQFLNGGLRHQHMAKMNRVK